MMMSAFGTKQTSVCAASMSALEVKRTKVYGDLDFCHRLGSTIFPFRRFCPLTLLSSLSGWPEQAGDALPTMTDAEKASAASYMPDMMSGICRGAYPPREVGVIRLRFWSSRGGLGFGTTALKRNFFDDSCVDSVLPLAGRGGSDHRGRERRARVGGQVRGGRMAAGERAGH